MSQPTFLKQTRRSTSQRIKLEHLTVPNDIEAVIEVDDLQDVSKTFGSTLIGYVVDKSVGKRAVLQCCNKWMGKQQVIFHSSGWVVIRFSSEEDRDKVLEDGPYYIFGMPFLLKPMPSLFKFNDCEIRQVPVWVQLPNLPLEFWSAKALSKIASMIGNPLNTDKRTRTMERICYARVLIEVDGAKDLPMEVKIRCPDGSSFTQEVVYEYVQYFCVECKAIGHLIESCPRNKTAQTQKPKAVDATSYNSAATNSRNIEQNAGKCAAEQAISEQGIDAIRSGRKATNSRP